MDSWVWLKALSIQSGHEVEALVRSHQDSVRGFLSVLGCPRDRVDDLCQDVFLSVLSSGFIQRSEAATRAFLRKVARHILIKAMERERRHLALGEMDHVEELWTRFDDGGERGDYLEALRGCLRLVRGRASEVVDLRYKSGMALVEIGQRLGLRESGVKSILVRTRRMLRDCIERRRVR